MRVLSVHHLGVSTIVFLVLIVSFQAKPSSAAAIYRARLVAELELSPRDPLLNIGGPRHMLYNLPPESPEGTTFVPGGNVYAIDIAQTMFFEVECEGSAIWDGSGDAANASGFCVATGSFDLTNGYPDTQIVDAHISVREFRLEGSVDVDASEMASVELYIHLEPDDSIPRTFDNPIFSFIRNTRDDTVDTHFDIVGLPQEFHIPLQVPGGEDGASPGEFLLRLQSINLRVGIRVRAISFVTSTGTMEALTFVPDPPKDPVPSQLIHDRIKDLFDYYQFAIKSSLITGANSSSKNLQTFSGILDSFYKAWQKNDDPKACASLLRAILQSDPGKPPADLITGNGIAILQGKMIDLAAHGLRCPIGREKTANELSDRSP